MTNSSQIVFFHIGSGSFGGGSKMLLRLLQSLDRRRFEPILLSQTNDELCRRVEAENINVNIVPFHGTLDTYNRNLLTNPGLLPFATVRLIQYNFKVHSILREADVIWCKNLRAVLTLYPYLYVSQTPVIWNIGLGLKSEGKIKYLNSLALRCVDHLFIESEVQARRIFTQDQFETHSEKITVLHKGIDVRKFNPNRISTSNHNEFYIGTASALVPRKGLHHLIDAFSTIKGKYKDSNLFIAGVAPKGNEGYKAQLDEQISDLDIQESVNLLGWVEDMPNFLSTLDIFVLPSRNEGIPGAIREAMAMKVPVVATDVGGTSDVVRNGKTGFLIPPGDTKALVHALDKLLSDPTLRSEMGVRGRQLIENEFSLEFYINEFESFLEQTVGE